MKTFIPLENNPEVLNPLAQQLGLSTDLAFYDVLSLTDPSLLEFIPRPSYALLFVYPPSPTIHAFDGERKISLPLYTASGPSEPVIYFKQTIINACGLIGLLHCLSNGKPAENLDPNSTLASLLRRAVPLGPAQRAQLVEDCAPLEEAYAKAAAQGDSPAPALGVDPGHSFTAFVKGLDGNLWELSGYRNGPVNLGPLGDGEDLLSEAALEKGPKVFLKMADGATEFSCTSLGPKE